MSTLWSSSMHFFDPTLDWPPELIQSEIPDLLYLKSDHPLDLSSRLQYTDPSNFVSSTTPWVEYSSLDGTQSLTLLFIDADYVQQQQTASQEIQSLLHDLEAQNVEIARYRKMAQASSSTNTAPETAFQIWCWAFRSLSRQTLRSSLSAFESFAKAATMSTTYMQSAVYRLLASESNNELQARGLPHSLLVHHFDGLDQTTRVSTFSQELLQEHSILEKTLLGHAANQQLTFTSSSWTDAMPLLS